jgi:hypothetical protein
MKCSALVQLGATVCAAALAAACSADQQTLPLIVAGDTVRTAPSVAAAGNASDGCPDGWSGPAFDDHTWTRLTLPIASVAGSGVCLRKKFDIAAPLERYRWLTIRLSSRSRAQLNPGRPVTSAEERGGIDWNTDDDDRPTTPDTPTREYALDLRLFPTLLQASDNVLALQVPETNQAVEIEALLQKDSGADVASAAVQRGPWLIHPTDSSVQIAWEAGRASPSWAVVDDVRRDGGWAVHHEALADGLVTGRTYPFWVETGEESLLPAPCRGVASKASMPPDDPGSDDYWRYVQERDACNKVASAIRTQAAKLHVPGTRLHFVVLGDTRSHGAVGAATAAVLQAVAGEAPDLVVHTGDLVTGDTEPDWQSFFDAGKTLWANAAIVPVAGERDLGPWVDRFSQLFGLDGSGPAGRAYSVDVGGVHLALIDDEAGLVASAGWLDDDLTRAEAAGAKRLFVVLHRGPYSSGASQGNRDAAAQLVPVLARHPVAAVLSGHDNLYDHQLVDGRHYFVTGGAGPAATVAVTPSATSQKVSTAPHYLVIDVGPTGVTVQAKDANGQVFDQVALN